MEKTYLVKELKGYFKAGPSPLVIDILPAQYLSLTGKGDPSEPLFNEKIQALYPVAYAVKFMAKQHGYDFVVPKLEAQWWFDSGKYKSITMQEAPVKIPRKEWEYRLMIMMPEFITAGMVTDTIAAVEKKKNNLFIKDITLFKLHEGKSVQVLHTGPYATEPATLAELSVFMDENNFKQHGLHHEIYLSDFRKTEPAKLKTILREPVI